MSAALNFAQDSDSDNDDDDAKSPVIDETPIVETAITPSNSKLDQLETLTNQTEKLDMILSSNFGNQQQKMQIQQLLGYTPPDLLQCSALRTAARNPITAGFVYTVSSTIYSICVSLTGVCGARNCLNACLNLMSGGSPVSKQIAKFANAIQDLLNIFAIKIRDYVLAMALIARETGKIQFALKYNAEPEAFGGQLLKVVEQMQQNDQLFKTEADKVLRQLETCNTWIIENMERDTVISDGEKQIAKASAEFESQQTKYLQIANQYWKQNAELTGIYEESTDELSSISYRNELMTQEIAAVDRLHQYLESRVVVENQHIDGITRNENWEIQKLHEHESQVRATISNMSNQIMKAQNARNDALRDRQRQKTQQIAQLGQCEANADPGGIFTHTKSSNGHQYYKKVVVRVNRRAEFTSMRECAEAELDSMNNESSTICDDMNAQMGRTSDAMAAAGRNTMNRRQQMITSNIGRRQEIQQRIQMLQQNMKQLTLQREQIKQLQIKLFDRRANVTKIQAETKQKLLGLENTLKPRMIKAEELNNECFEVWKQKRITFEKKMKMLSAQFGNDSYSLISFLKILRILSNYCNTLILSFQSISTSFEATQQSFAGDSFIKELHLIPKENRKAAMLELATNYQSIALCAQRELTKPILALIMRDTMQNMQELNNVTQQNMVTD